MAKIRLFVGNLSYDATEDELRALFSEVGRPTVINIMKHYGTNRPRGFAFVTLDTLNNEEEAWRFNLQGRIFKGRSLDIDLAIPREKAERNE